MSRFSDKFKLYSNNIQFGIKDIKSLTGVIQAIHDAEQDLKKKSIDFNWMDIIIYLAPKINATAFKALCSIGFFSTKATNVSRNTALYEYLIFRELTKAEVDWITNNYTDRQLTTMSQCLRDLAPTKKL